MFILDMSSKKTISINPNLFNMGGKKGKNKTLKKSKPKPNKSLIKPNTLKKNLLQRIKEHQKQQQQKKINVNIGTEDAEENEATKEFSNDFNTTLKYLNELAKSNQNKKNEKRKRRKKHLQSANNIGNTATQQGQQAQLSVNTELPSTLQSNVAPVTFHNTTVRIPPSPPYGILKNGSKPLYRDWKNKTIKRTKFDSTMESHPTTQPNMLENSDQATNIQSNKDNENLTRRERLNELQRRLREKNKKKESDDILVKTKKRTFRKKYKLGKSKGFNKNVSVLIGNQATRKKIQKDKQSLKKKSVEEIKTYLRNRGFLKVGSDAPVDVLRQMYENSVLTGEIKNSGKGVLIDNYLAEITEKIKNPEKENQDDSSKELNL